MTEPTYTLHFGDCIPGMTEHLDPESVDLTVTSIPFAAIFQYSGKTEDVGNARDGIDFRDTEFGLGFRFFLEQLYRVMAPGAISCIHVQQLITTQTEHGYMGRRDFRGAIVDMFATAGFHWRGEVCIPKNPQVIAQRQKLHSLLFITGKRDARKLAPAVNDYVLIFGKPGDGKPVPALYDVEKNPGGWLTTEEWIRDAHGVWTDIRETDVLEGWKDVREEGDERHVCPLQLEVIRRCVRLYSNPGDLVMDPFMGIGSTAYVALEQGRDAVGFELKESYYEKSLKVARLAMRNRQESSPEMPLFADLESAS